MSGSEVPRERLAHFQGFLRKPFSIDDLCALLAARETASGQSAAASDAADQTMLNPAIYEAFSQSLPADQVQRLYRMCLDDADQRIGVMRKAVAEHDFEAFHRSAHAIKGGCGMVGAVELAAIAEEMESSGPDSIGDTAPLERFLSASARLRRMLDAQ